MFILFITRAEKNIKILMPVQRNVPKARLDDATLKTELFIRTYTGKCIAALCSILSLSCFESREKYHCFVFGFVFMFAHKLLVLKMEKMILITFIMVV